MIRCPACKSPMNEVSVPANPGTLIVLDQCSECGGIWCDQWELFPIDAEEAMRLDPVDEELLHSPVELKKDLYCPRCGDRLLVFKDPLLPPDIQFQRCRRCDGIWLKRGQLRRFKGLQRKTRAEKLGADRRLQRLVAASEDPTSWVTTGTQGIFAYPPGRVEAGNWISNTLTGAVRLILQALLRLILRI